MIDSTGHAPLPRTVALVAALNLGYFSVEFAFSSRRGSGHRRRHFGIWPLAECRFRGTASTIAVSVVLNTGVDVAVACAAGRIRSSAAGRPNLIRRLREISGGAMIALGIGLTLATRPGS